VCEPVPRSSDNPHKLEDAEQAIQRAGSVALIKESAARLVVDDAQVEAVRSKRALFDATI
jgi:hypothetical protein